MIYNKKAMVQCTLMVSVVLLNLWHSTMSATMTIIILPEEIGTFHRNESVSLRIFRKGARMANMAEAYIITRP